jgi:hypothetical protein
MEQADNPLADAVQNITKIQNPLACWKTLGLTIPPQFLISK